MQLTETYREILDDQAADWSDLFFQLILDEETTMDEARLLMAPTQFERTPGTRRNFTFRVAHAQGYGVFSDLAESCLGKLDARDITGKLSLERVTHGVKQNFTQGAV